MSLTQMNEKVGQDHSLSCVSVATVHFVSSALIKIQQELMHLHPTYNILSARSGDSDRQLAVVKKKFAFFHQKFKIDSVYGEYMLEGLDVFAHSYKVMKNGLIVATVSKKFFSMTDAYGVEIGGEEDDVFILALVIVLDQVIFDNNKSAVVFT